MSRRLTKREKKIAAITGALVAGFVAFRLGFTPILERYQLLSARERNLRGEYLRARRNVLLQKAVEREREVYAREISRQGSDQEEQSFLLREIERLSRELPIRLRGMRPLPHKELGFYQRYAVSMEIEGAVGHVMKFVHMIESSPKLLKVERLRLTANSRKRGYLVGHVLVSRPAVGRNEPSHSSTATGG